MKKELTPGQKNGTKIEALAKNWRNLYRWKSLGFWTPGKIYGNVKIHKIGNPKRVITSNCNTAIENLSSFGENVLYDIAPELPSTIKDKNHMLNIIDNLNSLDLPLNPILVTFDIINMFPDIDIYSRLSSVKNI